MVMLTYIPGRLRKTVRSRALSKCRIAEMRHNESNHGAYFEILPIFNVLNLYQSIPFPLHSILSLHWLDNPVVILS